MNFVKVQDVTFNQTHIEDIIGNLISGITDIERNDVRPAHQPKHPSYTQNKDVCVFNIHREVTKGYWGQSGDKYYDRSEATVNLYFYGLNSYKNINMFKRGIFIEQNRYELMQNGMNIIKVSDIYEVPIPMNGIELLRHDINVFLSIARNMEINGSYFSGIPEINFNGGK